MKVIPFRSSDIEHINDLGARIRLIIQHIDCSDPVYVINITESAMFAKFQVGYIVSYYIVSTGQYEIYWHGGAMANEIFNTLTKMPNI